MNTPYSFQCILLSGMPCTGKDTLSLKLMERDSNFVLFRKHRADPALHLREDDNYINVSIEEFQSIKKYNGFIQFHTRYGRLYGVSKEEYTRLIEAHKVPIIHVGKYENLKSFRASGLSTGLSLLLWARRDVVQVRLMERHRNRPDGIEERLVAYDEEIAQLKNNAEAGPLDFDFVFVNNGTVAEAAEALLSLLHSFDPKSQRGADHEIRQFLGI